MPRKFKVALVHDSLLDFGGGERVLLALHEIWPEAPVFVSVMDLKRMGQLGQKFASWQIIPSWFQKLPGAAKIISPLRFLLPLVWESFDFSGFDLVISSSAWGMAKSVITPADTWHLCYCHTPPRFLYGYPEAQRWTRLWPVRIYAGLVNHFLRFYDSVAAKRVDFFVANSTEVARRIRKFYRRDSVIINPPVEVPPKLPLVKKDKRAPFLFVGRLVSYKHPEWAIEACLKLKKPLVVIGDGPMRFRVEKMVQGKPGVKFLGRVSDQELKRWYRQCRALIFPVEKEDFGMIAVEAQGYGKPVIALWSGGAKETVVEGKTGIFFHQPTVAALTKALLKFEKEEENFNPAVIHRWARRFSKENFQRKIKKLVKEKLNA